MINSRLVVWLTLIWGQVMYVSCSPRPANPSSSAPSNIDMSQLFPPQEGGAIVGNMKGIEVKNGYKFNLGSSPDGTPYTSGWAYLGGRAGPGPNTGESLLPAGLWSDQAVDILYTSGTVVALSLALCSIYNTLSPIFAKQKKKSVAKKTPATTTPTKDSSSEEKKEQVAVKEEEKEEEKKTKEQRRRRRRREVDVETQANLTRLASIVLNAIASGECLQKSICQLGTQIGESPKGHLAFTLIDTLLPLSLHTNQYFITMKKALKGDNICEKFNCAYSPY